MSPADHYAEAERWIEKAGHATLLQEQTYDIARAQVHATLATVGRDVSRQAEVNAQAARIVEMCTCAHLGDIPAAITSVDPACPIHGGS